MKTWLRERLHSLGTHLSRRVDAFFCDATRSERASDAGPSVDQLSAAYLADATGEYSSSEYGTSDLIGSYSHRRF